jgi:hypothetical protein
MNYRIILIWGLLVVPDTSPAAELREPVTLDGVTSQRIDLDVSKSGSRKSVLIRTSFVEDERTRCPEDSGQLQISHGTLAQIRMALLSDPDGQASSNGWRSTLNPLDDETYQYRVALPNCRTDIAIREQILRDGDWKTLLVRRELRPSVPIEERRELERQRLNLERQKRDDNRNARRAFLSRILGELRGKETADLEAARDEAAAAQVKEWRHEALTSREALFFDDTPPSCFTARSYYRVERMSVTFSFLAPEDVAISPPPVGGVNQFLIETLPLDDSRSRLYFTRGECRWELTVSQFVSRNGQWIAVPLARVSP